MAGFQKMDPWGPVPTSVGSGTFGVGLGGGMDALSVMSTPAAGIDWIGMGSNVLGKALQGGQSNTSRAESFARTETSVDNSGWNVNFGDGSKIDSDRTQTGLDQIAMYIGLAVGALTLWKAMKK